MTVKSSQCPLPVISEIVAVGPDLAGPATLIRAPITYLHGNHHSGVRSHYRSVLQHITCATARGSNDISAWTPTPENPEQQDLMPAMTNYCRST